MPRFLVAVSELQAQVDPLSGDMWKCAPIPIDEVKAAMAAGRNCDVSWAVAGHEMPVELQREFHVRRIAWLAMQPVTDGDHPIMVAIAPDRVWVYDGNHRIAAAIARGEMSLEIAIAPFEADAVARTFPSATAI